MNTPTIGLALSGGGSRAIAFHLGCMRALEDHGLLSRVTVLSCVSGGSVIGALYAYDDVPFDEFERRIEALLRRGMIWGIARQTFLSAHSPAILLTLLASGSLALLGAFARLVAATIGLFGLGGAALSRFAGRASAILPRYASRTTAFERHLAQRYFGQKVMTDVIRKDLSVILNASELRTGTAFRFGSEESGAWRHGTLVEQPRVATAVAASAAFPAALPALDEYLLFEKNGEQRRRRVMISDGGIYDNLGVSPLLPGRKSEFSTNANPVDFIIACDAGQGTPTGREKTYFWPSRMLATINTIHRRTQTQMQNLLHVMAASGEIDGFLLPYLGQLDRRLPYRPDDLVSREDTFEYPTNFSPMPADAMRKIALRGEQLTRLLLELHAPHL